MVSYGFLFIIAFYDIFQLVLVVICRDLESEMH